MPSKSVKLSEDLTALAESEGAIEQRSVPRQIEYWSNLGRVIERHLTKTDTHDLLKGRKVIERIMLVDTFPTGESIMAELETDRSNGTLSSTVTQAAIKYEAVEGESSLFRRILADGSSEIGTVRKGLFIAQDPQPDNA